MSLEAGDEGLDIFQEPADFYQPEKQATFASHQLLSGKDLTVRLVGHNPLWVSFHPPTDFLGCIVKLLFVIDASETTLSKCPFHKLIGMISSLTILCHFRHVY